MTVAPEAIEQAEPVVPPDRPKSGATWRKPIALSLLIIALALLGTRLPLDRLPDWTAQLGPIAPAAAIVVSAILLSALVPRTAISLACGALFGAGFGAAWSLSGALVAALITFYAGRWAGRDLVRAKAGARLARLDAWLARRGMLAVIVVRLLPIAPFGMVGYAYGASSVRLRDFLGGTAIGGIPSSISYATIGAAVVAPAGVTVLTFVPAATGVLASLCALAYWRYQERLQPA